MTDGFMGIVAFFWGEVEECSEWEQNGLLPFWNEQCF